MKNRMRRQILKRAFIVFLATVMLFSNVDLTAFATPEDGKEEIIQEEETTEETVSGNDVEENGEDDLLEEEGAMDDDSIQEEAQDEEPEDKKIISFVSLPEETATINLENKLSYDELYKLFPDKLSVTLKNEQCIDIDVQWKCAEEYGANWEELIFTACIGEEYTVEDGITLPAIVVQLNTLLQSVETNVVTLEGDGTEESPYLIYSAEDFAFVRENNDQGIYYTLMNDIDLADVVWVPLGLANTNADAFCANLDGNGYKIYNLNKFATNYSSYGIFGYVRNASISNLGIVVKKGIQINSPDSGGIMMKVGNNCAITNCYVIGDYVITDASDYAGILAYQCNNSTIANCFTQGYVFAYGSGSLTHAVSAYAGGVIAEGNSHIINCVSHAEVVCKNYTSSCYSGGICAKGAPTIENCLFIGETKDGRGKILGQISGYSNKYDNPAVTNSYYLKDNSANWESEKYGIGKTVEELRDQSTYEGWDFVNVWTMNDPNNAGFPMLKSMVGIERDISKYLLPTPVDYSQRSEQVILSNNFEFDIYFDRNIGVKKNGGVYLRDNNGIVIECFYEVINDRELHIETNKEIKMKNGKKYTLIIEDDCVYDLIYPNNYYVGQENQYFVTVCKPEFEGDGSIKNPYVISTINQLNCVYYQPTKNYILANDIDASGVDSIKSIGGCKDTSGTQSAWPSKYDTLTQGEKSDFSGVFDGNGYTISGIKKFSGQHVTGYYYDTYVGLFSSVNGGTIKNLNVEMAEDCYLYNERQGTIVDTFSYPYVSILVAKGSGSIINCSVNGTVFSNQGTSYAGLLTGYFKGTIERCSAYGDLNARSNYVGALTGLLTKSSTVRDSYAMASVTGYSEGNTGGLIGYNNGSIVNSYAAGEVSDGKNIGGLVGNNNGTVTESFYDTTISGLSDTDKGTPLVSSKMKNIATYKNWNFVDFWGINTRYNAGYPFHKTKVGYDKEYSTTTMIHVMDGIDLSKCVSEPEIKLYDENQNLVKSYSGNEDGIIELDELWTNKTWHIEVSAENYGTYINEKYYLEAFTTGTILLYPITDKPAVYSAYISLVGKDGDYRDILQKKKVISKEKNEKYDLYVASTYKKGIEQICLVQGGKIKKRSRTGYFQDLSADSFNTNEIIYIEAVGKDGETSKLYQTYLSVVAGRIEPKDEETSISEDFSIEIDSDIPILGGMKLKLNDLFDDMELFETEISNDGKVKFTVNLEAKDDWGTEEYEQLKKVLDYGYIADTPKEYNEAIKYYISEYDKYLVDKNLVTFDNVEIGGKIFGYVEIDLLTQSITESKIAVMIESKISTENGFMVGPIPLVLVIDLSASAEGSITVNIYEEEWYYEYALNAKVGLSAGIGPGIPKLASLTINAAGELEMVANWNEYLKLRSTLINLRAHSYIKLRILTFETEQDLVDKTYCLYDSNASSKSLNSTMSGDVIYNAREEDFDVSTVVSDSTWTGGVTKTRALNSGTSVCLLENVYGNSTPQIVEVDGTKMIVYLHQSEEREAINSTEVVYSIYDEESDTWSSPQTISDDGTADFYPYVFSESGEIYVIWQNMSEIAPADLTLNDFASLGSISIAKYDVEADSFITTHSAVKDMISNPYLDSTSGKTIWIKNEVGDFVDTANCSIQIADFDGTSINNVSTLVADAKYLLTAKIGKNETDTVVAYVCDTDGDFLTIDDHVLTVVGMEGDVLFTSDMGAISDIEYIEWNGHDCLAYSMNGSLVVLDNYAPVELINGDVPIVNDFTYCDGEIEYLLFDVVDAENNAKNIYAYSYNDSLEKWNPAVPVTCLDSQITWYSVLPENDGMQLLYQETTVVDGNDNSGLYITSIEPTVDMCIEQLMYDEEFNCLQVSAELSNSGLKAVDGYRVSIYGGTTEIYREDINETIGVGESAGYELVWENTYVSEYEKPLKIVVTPINAVDANTSDNERDMVVGYPDISMMLTDEVMCDNAYIADLELYNGGNYATSGKINIYVTDELIDTIEVPEIVANDYETLQILVDTTELESDKSVELIKFVYEADLIELYLQNNTITSNIYLNMDANLCDVEVDNLDIAVGESKELSLNFRASDGKDNRLAIQPMLFEIEDESIATIGEDGRVTGESIGTTNLTIQVTDIYGNSAEGICTITVSENDKGSGLWISGINESGYTYTGKAIQPEIKVYANNTRLYEKKDYTISYKNNIAVNDNTADKKAPTIIIKGKGNYEGQIVSCFTILPKTLSDEDVLVTDLYAKANGRIQKKIPTVTWNGKKLRNNLDYTVEYPDMGEVGAYKEPGTYDILVKGKGNFTGERTVSLIITGNELISKAYVEKIEKQKYIGMEIEPELTVRYGLKELVKDTDYTVVYKNNVKIGTASAVITGIGNYSGTKTVTFEIAGTSITGATVTGIPTNFAYSGEAFTADSEAWETPPELTVKIGGTVQTLVAGTDYDITYRNNVSKGTALVTFAGINAYSGKITKSFRISAYDINKDASEKINISLENEAVNFVKGGSRPKPVVKFGDIVLTVNKDYTLRYVNNTKINDGSDESKMPTIIITGKGNFTGSVEKTFTIIGSDISGMEMTADDRVFVNDSGIFESEPIIVDTNGKKLKKGKDYSETITYCYKEDTTLADGVTVRKAGDIVEEEDIIPTGTVIEVIAVGQGDYEGLIKSEYRIVEYNISKARVNIEKQDYTGRGITLDAEDITVEYGDKELVLGTDYEIVSYKDNINRGKAKVTIRGIGDYGGTKTVKFTIKSKLLEWWEDLLAKIFG